MIYIGPEGSTILYDLNAYSSIFQGIPCTISFSRHLKNYGLLCFVIRILNAIGNFSVIVHAAKTIQCPYMPTIFYRIFATSVCIQVGRLMRNVAFIREMNWAGSKVPIFSTICLKYGDILQRLYDKYLKTLQCLTVTCGTHESMKNARNRRTLGK